MIGGIGANYNIGIIFAYSKDLYMFDLQAFALEVDKIDAVMMSPGITNFVSRRLGDGRVFHLVRIDPAV